MRQYDVKGSPKVSNELKNRHMHILSTPQPYLKVHMLQSMIDIYGRILVMLVHGDIELGHRYLGIEYLKCKELEQMLYSGSSALLRLGSS